MFRCIFIFNFSIKIKFQNCDRYYSNEAEVKRAVLAHKNQQPLPSGPPFKKSSKWRTDDHFFQNN